MAMASGRSGDREGSASWNRGSCSGISHLLRAGFGGAPFTLQAFYLGSTGKEGGN
jgi:hypothetical protein